MHPSDAIRNQRSRLLAGRRIVVGISGSIAAVEAPRVIRELIRHGAQVDAVMTKDALGIITAEAVRFATGRPPVTEITGDVEHVRHLGPGPGRADLLLLAPATANTLSKVAQGIDDTPVTTFASIALGGGVPVLVAPAMHADMTRNPAVRENLQRLERMGVGLIPSVEEEGESKLPPPEVIAAHVLHRLARGPWSGRRVLVVGGSSSEPIDDVRSVTNEGTGRTAVDLALQAFYRGAHVEAWMGEVRVPLPSFLPLRRFRTLADLEDLLKGPSTKGPRARSAWDLVIVPAALSDFTLSATRGKIPSQAHVGGLRLELRHAQKVLPRIRKTFPPPALVVGFKLESGLSRRELVQRAQRAAEESGCDAIVANDRASMGGAVAEVIVVRRHGKDHPFAGPKAEVAGKVLDDLAADLPPRLP